ncbi:MAG TPA: riboflavin biosynthesis protein RibF [Thermomicrobiales bacterium]|nr:riboflavin biosynthesis protein RibF [Thermomicrobiales bacterium]
MNEPGSIDFVAVTPLEALPPGGRVVSVGTFDGVHLGHRHLLRRTVERANDRDLRSLAVTFEPPPAAVLRPDRFAGRICEPDDKLRAIAATGVDEITIIPFTRDYSRTSPEQFMADLSRHTHLRELWVGEGFALGKDRTGDIPRLTEIGQALGFAVVALPRISLGGETVSSSEIRRAIEAGDARKAWRLLGRPFRVSGEVVEGQKVGRALGFPTANVVPPPDLVLPADGIYAAWAWLPDDAAPRPAVTYIGKRPAVNTGERMIETHLLDFDADIYGQILRVDLLDRVRPDANFPSVEALIAQVETDKANARRVLVDLAPER